MAWTCARSLHIAINNGWLIVTLALATAPAQSPSQPPRAVLDRVAGELAGEDGRPAAIPAGMIRPVDINHDGVADWQVEYARAGEATWCGTGGCRYELYVSRGDGGHVLGFNEIVRSFAVRARRVSVDVYGSYCGTAGVVGCFRSFGWSATEGRLVPLADQRQDPRLFGPLFQPVPIANGDLPATVAEAIAERGAACAAAGATLDEASSAIVRSPDLDGDGREDWIVGGPWSACRPPDTMPEAEANALPHPVLAVLAGSRTAPQVIFQGATSDYVVDITTRPARLILMPDDETRMRRCPRRPTHCAGTMLRYDAEKRWLEPFTPVDARPSPPLPRTGRHRDR